jgi:hypothetical protein
LSSKLELLACVAGSVCMRSGRLVVVPNIVIFHVIHLVHFLYGFQPIFLINCQTLFDIINENTID